MVVQGIVVNSGNQQESGSNIKVLKIQYDGFGNPPVIIENTTNINFTIDVGSTVGVTPSDNTYFLNNKFWFDTYFVFDDSDPMNSPIQANIITHYVTTSGKLNVMSLQQSECYLTIFVI